MRIPDSLDITIKAGGRPAAQMLGRLKFSTSRKNPYTLIFGPSDSSGVIHVTREEILTEARKSEDFFIMDFAGLEASWTGNLIVTPLNREAIRGALSAFQLFRRYPYRANYKEYLDAAEAVLAQIPKLELVAAVECSAPEKIHIETVAVLAT